MSGTVTGGWDRRWNPGGKASGALAGQPEKAVDSRNPMRCRGQNPMRVVRDREVTHRDFGNTVEVAEPQERSIR